METTQTQRAPLSAKNTGPKQSRLPQPSTTMMRKRHISQVEQQLSGPGGKENGPAVKRARTTLPTKPTRVIVAKPSIVKTSITRSAAVKNAKTAKPPLSKPSTTKTATSKAKSSIPPSTKAPKRPAWDLKGQIQDMAVERKTTISTIETLQDQLQSFSGRLGELEQLKKCQESTILVKEKEKTVAHSQIKELEDKISSTQHRLESLSQAKAIVEARAADLETSLSSCRSEVVSLKTALSQTVANMSAVQSELEATKMARDSSVADGARKTGIISSQEHQIAELQALVEDCRARTRKDETNRRALHNTIQELKGNIRVFCRVRPFLATDPSYLIDDTGRESSVSEGTRGSKIGGQSALGVVYPDSNTDQKKLSVHYSPSEKAKKSYDFTFDRVFGPNSTQELVFSEISQLVQSALDGYNVCVFAYGQTGSGKTFTMEGPEERVLLESEGEMKGMIPRAVDQVFASALQLKEKGWEYKMEAKFLEIYNETIRDLLSSNSKQSVDIKIDPNHQGEVYVTNVTPFVVTSQEQVQRLLERASKNRAVAATQCNERSSRSHSVFILTISGKNTTTGENCRGVLNLVDLAGSERLSSSGSAGERLKETKSINKSLSNLGSVIMALANKEPHVPYRNSKLTYLLQNSLGGNSKTLMFVNVSPQVESFQETLCSLRFATTVNQCNIGTAKKSSK